MRELKTLGQSRGSKQDGTWRWADEMPLFGAVRIGADVVEEKTNAKPASR